MADKACDDMKPINYTEDGDGKVVRSSLKLGTQLFELYLALQQFYNLGTDLKQTRSSSGSSEGSVTESKAAFSSDLSPSFLVLLSDR